MDWSFVQQPVNLTVKRGANATVTCRPPLSRPAAQVSWFKDNQLLAPTARVTVLPSGDLFFYRCVCVCELLLFTCLCALCSVPFQPWLSLCYLKMQSLSDSFEELLEHTWVYLVCSLYTCIACVYMRMNVCTTVYQRYSFIIN